MTIYFRNQSGELFSIKGKYFDIIDSNNVFDSFQEDNNYFSENIFKCSGEKVKQLSDSIRNINTDNLIEINQLANFIENSNGIIETTC